MDIKTPGADEYLEPLKKLFPQGSYWDNLLSDSASDISLVCKARSESIADFRTRINQLLRESFPARSDETIGDWERVYFGYEKSGAGLDIRRTLLITQTAGNGINIEKLNLIAQGFGGSASILEIPYRPAAFGHAQFGLTYMSTVAGMWVVFVYCSVPKPNRSDFESAVKSGMLANQTIFFIYGD